VKIAECDLPRSSILDRSYVENAYFRDSYEATLTERSATMTSIFLAVFGHHPQWMKNILIVRNRIAYWCGLDVPSDDEINKAIIKDYYSVGDKIGPWPIYYLSESELVAGRDNSHLDFRLSLLRVIRNGAPHIIVSTVCTVHNIYGKIYLFFIVPFHKWGVQRLIADAIEAGRL
jgi:Protein of unknown function (DUF2867)